VVEEQMLPARGVYAGRVLVPSGDWRAAVVNLGERPTFGGGGLVVEAHLIDFAGDLYDARVRLSFQARLRGEQRFASAAALVERIHEDVRVARELLAPPAGV
jgi:riboflavin kinase/FMN adenylyltransferase